MDLSPWADLVSRAGLPGTAVSRLSALTVKSIKISQAKHVWELSFGNSFPVNDEDRELAQAVLRSAFGREYAYNLTFEEREAGPDAASLLQETLKGRRPAGESLSQEEEEALLNRCRENKAAGQSRQNQSGPRLILGRKVTGEPTPLSQVREECRSLTVRGSAFKINDMRQLKAGTYLYDFALTDLTGSLRVKLFADPARQKKFSGDWLRQDDWYLMRGTVKYDQYTRELTFFPNDIMTAESPQRCDRADVKRVELHLHTKMSAMDAVSAPEDLVRQAIAWGHEAVAITDHGVVQAFPAAMKLARVKWDSQGRLIPPPIKIIYGLEGYLIEGDGRAYMAEARRPKKSQRALQENLGEGELAELAERAGSWHIILLAKNQTGIKNLYKLVSLSHLDFFYRRPRIPRQALERYREGLIVGSACEAGEMFQKVLNGEPEEVLEKTAAFYDYLEIQPIQNNAYLLREGRVESEAGLQELNRRILALGRRLHKPVCATGDVHFLAPEDEIYRRILQAGQDYKDADRQPPLFFRTTEEMLAEFAYLGQEEAYRVVVEATREIAAQVEYLNPIPDRLMTPKIEGAEDSIKTMAVAKAHAIYGERLPELIQKRLDRELESIIGAGYAVLYLIAHKLVKHANDAGYMVGSRGSVGSSLVAFLTDITEVNPLPPHYLCRECQQVEFGDPAQYGCGADMPDKVCPRCGRPMAKEGFNIPFEVFLGFEGDKVPDIDLNFSGEYQSQAQKYTEELFGPQNVFKAGTISTVAEKTAYGFVRHYFSAAGQPLSDSEADRLARGCTGVKRTTGQHPGGIVVLPKGDEITNYTPVQRPADDIHSEFVTTHFDYHAIDKCLVKLDLLGHDVPTIIKLLEDMTGLDASRLPLDEPRVLSLFRSPEALGLSPEKHGIETGTIGLPEFGTGFVREMLRETLPRNFSDLVRISGFSHGTDVWLGNARDILKAGLGTMKDLISCRDDIMLYLVRMGTQPRQAFRIMETVRKGKKLGADDITAMEEAGVPDWYIGSCQKIKYLFPKAHAVAYVTSAMHIAWFKLYRPLAYYAAIFSVRGGVLDGNRVIGGLPEVEKALEEIREKRENKEAAAHDEELYSALESAREMLLRGFKFLPADLLKSSENRYLMEGEALRLPFTALPGLGLTAAQSIVAGRQEKPYLSCEDLKKRGKVGKSLLEALRAHGALGNLPESDQQSLF